MRQIRKDHYAPRANYDKQTWAPLSFMTWWTSTSLLRSLPYMTDDASRAAGAAADIDDRQKWLDILHHNHGFLDPENWIDYARSHAFQKVDAKPILECPDCGATASTVLGQYVYYSTLIRLRSCAKCGLAYSDARIDPDIVSRHFDFAYKDEEYFVQRREPIFRYLTQLVDAYAPNRGKVIDIGGAKGHLLAAIRDRRSDLSLTLNDFAEGACAYARDVFGLHAIRASVGELAKLEERFDVILMIDVLYYESEIRKLWQTIDQISGENSTVILRLPERIGIIRLQRALGGLLSRKRSAARTSIYGFNPEHVAVYSKTYLNRRLASLGFAEVRFLPSPLLRSPGVRGVLATCYQRSAQVLHGATRGCVTFAPSFIVVARRSQG